MRATPRLRLIRRRYRARRRRLARQLGAFLGRLGRGEQAFMILAAMGIGLLSGYGAIAFRLMIRLAHGLFFQTSQYSLADLQAMSPWLRLLLPSLGGLAVGIIVVRLAPEVRGSGIPEVMEAVARRGGIIRFRVLAAKALAAALTIGSGGSAGREGPIVHIGSAIGDRRAHRRDGHAGCGVSLRSAVAAPNVRSGAGAFLARP